MLSKIIKLCNTTDVDVNEKKDRRFLFNMLEYMSDKDIIKDDVSDFYIYSFDANIFVTIDNINDILNNKNLYIYTIDTYYILDYLTIDDFIIDKKYINLLIVKLIELIEYYENTLYKNNVNSTLIYSYIINLINILKDIYLRYEKE